MVFLLLLCYKPSGCYVPTPRKEQMVDLAGMCGSGSLIQVHLFPAMWVTEYLSSPEPQDLDPSVPDLCRGSCQTAWLIIHAGAWHVSFAGMASLHPSKSGDQLHDSLPASEALERLQQVRLKVYQPQGWWGYSWVPVLDCRSGTALNTCLSCTARLLLFLPTTCCSN